MGRSGHSQKEIRLWTSRKGRSKQEQTKPIIFERFRSRVTRQLRMSAKTAADLDRYIEWACAEVDAEAHEALTLVLDQALAQLFQRDKLFQDALKEKEERERRTHRKSSGVFSCRARWCTRNR